MTLHPRNDRIEEDHLPMPLSLRAIRWAAARLIAASFCLGLVACNTVAGAGKDVSNAGTAISNTAQSVQQKM
jgi:predicted small secreted protein